MSLGGLFFSEGKWIGDWLGREKVGRENLGGIEGETRVKMYKRKSIFNDKRN